MMFSFPSFDIFILAWCGLVPLLISLWKKDWRQSFREGFIFGIIYFFGTLYWIYHSINHFGGLSLISSIFIVCLLCCYLSLYPAVFASLFSRIYGRTKLPAMLVAPVLWVTLEFIRSYAFSGFPWSSIGYSQYRFLPLIQIADITGIYGISFIVISVNGLIADIFLMKKRRQEMPLFPYYHFTAGCSILLLLLTIIFGYGFWRLNEQRSGKSLKVSLIQGNIEQDKKWETSFQNEVMDIYTSLSLEAAKNHPSLIIWPETAVPFFFGSEDVYTSRLLQFQQQSATPLLFGSVLVKKKNENNTELANSAVLLDREAKKIYSYDKIHLVPFGEYVPLRNILFFIDKLVVGIGDYMPGQQYLLADSEIGRFGTLICYEIIFPGMVRKFYTRGGDFIVTITNDAWFGKTAGPYQHFSMAVFRAVENRKPVLRSANTGISGFIDSNGRIQKQSMLFDRLILTDDIKTDSSMTFYTKFGDLFSFLCIVSSIIMVSSVVTRR